MPLMLRLLLCLLAAASATIYQYEVESEILRPSELRISGVRNRTDKDFVLGGLFPIHITNSSRGGCGDFRRQGGLERMEAMLFAIDVINADPALLPNLTLGFDVRDTCSIESIGLDEALDLIVTGRQLEIESCQSDSSAGENMTDVLPPTIGIVGASVSRVSANLCSPGSH